MNRLPEELFCHLMQFVPLESVVRSERVCRRWRRICFDVFWLSTRHITLPPKMPLAALADRLDPEEASIEKLTLIGPRNLVNFELLAPKLVNLTQIAFSDVELSNAVLVLIGSHLANLKDLQIDYFTGSHRTYRFHPPAPDFDDGLQYVFAHCRRLQKISLHLDRIPYPITFRPLQDGSLVHLSLKTRYYKGDYFEDLFLWLFHQNRLESLELNLTFDEHITDWWEHDAIIDFLDQIALKNPQMARLQLCLAEHWRREDYPLWKFVHGVKNFSDSLRDLDLSYCFGLQSSEFEVIAVYVSNLERLSLRQAKIGIENSLHYLVACNKLQYLNLEAVTYCDPRDRGYHPLTDASLSFLLSMPQIRELVLDWCTGLSAQFLVEIAGLAFDNLRKMSVRNCAALSEALLRAIVERLHGFHEKRAHVQLVYLSVLLNDEFCTNLSADNVISRASGVAKKPLCGLWCEGMGKLVISAVL